MSQKTKILIIDDDDFFSDILSAKFTEQGFEARRAPDGETGLKMMKKDMPDVVLLDILMPGMNGYGVLEEIKKNKEIKNVKVMILSSLGQREDIEKGMAAGAADYLIKTHLTPAEIVLKIKQAIS
ncbi:response regulator [Patescibacteria group bacterium]|nr:response regulator [Patescibacteria group bacterium]MBU1921803.1 response regulator [Patescibacteria group bacterium]